MIPSLFKRKQYSSEKLLCAVGAAACHGLRNLKSTRSLSDVELSISSQWGEDGIIDWLISKFSSIPKTFVEFGVENYKESNTRFLLQNRNWRGLVIDGSMDNISYLRNDPISWKHNLNSLHQFVTRENIDALISSSGFNGDVGLLSIDLDGNDYWVWEAITSVSPFIVVVEYNTAFGDIVPLSIPYDSSFIRSQSHFSNLYYGASIASLIHLASAKGYVLLGSNSAGSNAFFVRSDFKDLFFPIISDTLPRPSLFRESRDQRGMLTYVSGLQRSKVISHMPVIDVSTGITKLLSEFNEIFTINWTSQLS